MKMKACMMVALWCVSASVYAADPEMFWFKNETACAGAKITVRSYCEVSHREHAGRQVNSLCTEQEVIIARPGKQLVKHDLLEHEPIGEDFHTASGLRCVATEGQHYLLISLDNGGNCSTCEINGLMSLDGQWKRYGKHWRSARASEQRAIRRGEARWWHQEPFWIKNTVRETK